MNIFQLLPLLEGWSDMSIDIDETIVKKDRLIYNKYERGWLLGLDLVTDDAFGSMRIRYGRRLTSWVTPYALYAYNAVYPPPAGSYYLLYNQPAPPSTAGLYVASLFTSAYPLPYKGKIQVWVRLGDSSTQSSASIGICAYRILIDNVALFKKSLKEVLEELGIAKV